MIFLFDKFKKLKGTVRNRHTISLLYERERNGLYTVSAEIPLKITDKKTVYNYHKKVKDSDFLGHYDREGRFQLHKIASVDIEDSSIFIKGVHLFFDEAKAGAIIQERRFRQSEIIDGARVAFDSIGWSVVDFDVSDTEDYIFYNASPLEARAVLVETFGFEFDYWLDFDGKNIRNKQISVKREMGKDSNKRYNYGHNVLNIKVEQDYSEIYTAVIGRGKGEDLGDDAYGRRIEYTDVEWKTPTHPMNKPKGSRVLHDENATQLFGYHEDGKVSPRTKVEIFEDIEEPAKLLRASYNWLKENSVPKAVFSLKVPDGDGLDLGDKVHVIYRDIDLVKHTRVTRVIDDLVSGNRDVEFGDTAYFKTDRRLSGVKSELKRVGGSMSSRISRLKAEFDRRFDNEVQQWKDDFEQALIDAEAAVEVMRVKMTEEFATVRTEMTNRFETEKAAAQEEAQKNYTALENYVNTTVDNNRSQVEQIINTAEQSAKDYAEQQAQEKAEAVRTSLETVTSGHQQMLDVLESNVMNIDDFLGDSRSVTLDERFQNITENFEERIRNIDSTHYNMIRGTSFDNPDLYSKHATVEIITNEIDNFARLGLGTTSVPYVMNTEYFNVEAGQTYHLIFMYRTNDVPEIDFIRLRPPSGYGGDLMIEDGMTPEEKSTTMSGAWTKKEVTFVSDRDMPVRLLLGTNFGNGNTQRGILDIKKPYLTTTNNREWLPHPDDDSQNVSEIVRRVTLLEDGRSELITRSEYDFETGQLDQHIKSVEETVEGNKQVLQRVENWQSTNGASIEETIYGFDQKVWLNDVANIGANLIPQSANAWENGGLWIEGGGETGSTQNLRTKERIKIQPNTTYTLSSNSLYVSAIERVDIHQYLYTGGWINRRTIPLKGEVSFTTWGTADSVRITLIARDGFNIPASFIEHPDGRVKIKLEVGDKATPMLNAISRFEQLADKVAIQVQELDGDFLTQSDIQVKPGYVQLGSQRLGDEQLASIFRVSPNSIDAITERMTLNGDLYVDGDITALAVSAINAEFSDLFAAQVRAGSVHADYVEGFSARFSSLYTLNANIERLTSQLVFTDAVHAKSLDAIEANIGRVRAAFLKADVISGSHIEANTIEIKHLTGYEAILETLMARSIFSSEVKALSIDAVEANIGSLRTQILTSNVIQSSHIAGGTALIDKIYSSTAMFERMMAKSGFVRTLNTVTIDTDQITIRRPDGARLVNNGMLQASFDVQIRPNHASSAVSFTGINYATSSDVWQTFEHFYTDHKGSKLLISWAVDFYGPSSSEYIEVRVRGFGGNNPIGTSNKRIFSDGSTAYLNHTVSLGVPDYRTIQAYLEFRRSPTGSSTQNTVRARVLRVSIID